MDEAKHLKPFATRHCPVCNSDQILRGSEISSNPKAEKLRFDELKPYWNGFFKQNIFFSYCRCPRCQLLFCREYLSSSQLQELYSQMPDNTAGVSIQALKKTQKSYFQALKKYSTLTGEYLEIGPDIGLFTENCVQEGAFEFFWLAEPNKSVHSDLKRVAADKKYFISTDILGYDYLPNNRISVVAMIHVLDHLIDPKATLIEINKKLINKAVLLFVTHDESSILAKIFQNKWPPYCLQHPQLFKPSSLKALMEISGYKVLKIIKAYNYFPALYLLKHVLWTAGIRGISIPNTSLFKVPLKLGNIITIATKRTPL